MRKAAGRSQVDVASQLGVTRAHVSLMEDGKTRILLEHLYNLAIVFGVPVSALLPSSTR